MPGNESLGRTVDLVFAWMVEVTGGIDNAVLVGRRREECGRESVLLDEFIGDNPKDLSPDFTNAVHFPVIRVVEGRVR